MPTCVGFGTGRYGISTRNFSWKLASHASLLPRGFAYLSRFTSRARILLCTCYSLRPQSNKWSNRFSVIPSFPSRVQEIRLFSIDYAFRPRLRSRLTQGGLNLPLESLGYRCAGFSPASRYSHRHSHFHALHHSLRVWLPRAWNAPLPLVLLQIRSFGMLSPGTFSAQGHSTSELLRTLLRMAASEPTS